ncbi:MAG: hypothetical protein RLZ56_443 [Bacteroidota bacterium]|jgi:hypothetical protein
MKKQLVIGLGFLFYMQCCVAQDTEGIHLQGIARNELGMIVANKQIALRLSIGTDSNFSHIVYQEIKSVTTNVLGLFFINLGSNENGKLITMGSFDAVDWSMPQYISIEIDPSNALSFTLMGIEKIQFVPKAFYASVAKKINSVVPIELGGTGLTNLRDIKQLMGIDRVSNTPDSLKPISIAMLTSLNEKLKKSDTLSLSNRINGKISVGGLNSSEITTGLGYTPVKNLFGQFYDTGRQTTLINTATAVKFFFQNATNKISVANNSNGLPTRITVTDAGIYHVNYSLQFIKTDAGNDEVNIWIRRNGSAYVNSNGIVIVQGNNYKNYFNGSCFVELGSNDYLEIFYFVKNANSIIAGTPANTQTPSRPAVPSASLTIHAVN